MKLVLAFALILSSSAWARDFKIVGQEFMPLQGNEGGQLGGAYVVAMKKMCEIVKFNCKFELVPLARSLEMAKAGEVQMVLGIGKNPEREAIFNFPGFLSQAGYTFFVKKGQAAKFKSIDDFKGKTVGVHKGSVTGKDLEERNAKMGNAIRVEGEATSETAPRKLAGGRYGDDGALYCARPVCLHQAKKENLDIEPVSFDSFMQNHTAPITKTGVSDAEFEQIKSAVKQAMKSPEVLKAFADAGLVVHPDMK